MHLSHDVSTIIYRYGGISLGISVYWDSLFSYMGDVLNPLWVFSFKNLLLSFCDMCYPCMGFSFEKMLLSFCSFPYMDLSLSLLRLVFAKMYDVVSLIDQFRN